MFTHKEGISTLGACHKERQPLIECAIKNNVITQLIIFPRAVNFFSFTIFFFFNQQGFCPCSYVSSGAMRKLNLRSSLSLNVCKVMIKSNNGVKACITDVLYVPKLKNNLLCLEQLVEKGYFF